MAKGLTHTKQFTKLLWIVIPVGIILVFLAAVLLWTLLPRTWVNPHLYTNADNTIQQLHLDKVGVVTATRKFDSSQYSSGIPTVVVAISGETCFNKGIKTLENNGFQGGLVDTGVFNGDRKESNGQHSQVKYLLQQVGSSYQSQDGYRFDFPNSGCILRLDSAS